MIWLTWRQHRSEAGAGAVVLVILVSGLILIGISARHMATTIGLPACISAGGDCSGSLDQIRAQYHWLPPFVAMLIGLPLVVGMFVGAPLVSREFESGTQRLVWTQSVTKLRWITVQHAIIQGVCVAAAFSLGMIALWALTPLTPAFGTRFNSAWFEVIGIVPSACVLLALALGVAASALWKRTIPAMAVTLVAYSALLFPIHFIRTYLTPPRTSALTLPISNFLGKPDVDPLTILGPGPSVNDLVVKTTVTGPPGHPMSNGFRALFQTYCPDVPSRGTIPAGTLDACRVKIAGLDVHIESQYLPAGRFWTLQAVEVLLLAVIAAGLIAAGILVVARRRSV